jgi:hypothetical protein
MHPAVHQLCRSELCSPHFIQLSSRIVNVIMAINLTEKSLAHSICTTVNHWELQQDKYGLGLTCRHML